MCVNVITKYDFASLLLLSHLKFILDFCFSSCRFHTNIVVSSSSAGTQNEQTVLAFDVMEKKDKRNREMPAEKV